VAFGSHLKDAERTMLRWKPRQRAVLVAMLPELANLGMAGLVFGQVIGDRPFSWSLVALGMALWLFLVSVTIAIAGVDES
jgi:hypothetical protein